jgi:hypothetical protein
LTGPLADVLVAGSNHWCLAAQLHHSDFKHVWLPTLILQVTSSFQDCPLFQATATSSTTASPCWQVCAQGTPALCSNAIVIQGWLSQSGLANNLPTRLLDTVPPACEQAGLTQLSGCSFASCRISSLGSMRTEQKSYRGLNTATMRQGQLVGPAVCWCCQARRPAWTIFMRLKLDDTAL